MKIGIIGSAERAVAWEKNLRPHRSVSEVIIARTLNDAGRIDACILLDDTDTRLELLMNAIKSGYHSFLVSRLPVDAAAVEKIYHASEESNVMVQFSHWPTLAPSSQWMFQKIAKPRFIQVVREISHTDFMGRDFDFDFFWIDELAFCIKWIGGMTHQVDVSRADIHAGGGGAIHLFLRFDSGATAAVFVTTASAENHHKRVASNHAYIMDCNVLTQTVRAGEAGKEGHLFFQKETFDASRSAELALTQFLKSIQLNKPTPFSAYDLFRTLNIVEKINKKIGV